MNVTYEIDEFVVEVIRFPLVIPGIPLETMIELSVATLGLHRFIADILNVTKTPTCTSKQLVSGKIIGLVVHVGCGRT